MQEPTHVRLISLVLASSVIVAGWLLFEYSNRQAELPRPLDEGRQNLVNRASQSPQPPASPAPRSLTIVPKHLAVTYKCEKDGRISYGDQPCSGKERTLSITATEKEAQTEDNLQQLQGRLAAMEAARREREKKFAATVLSTSWSTADLDPVKSLGCNAVDQEIAFADSRLRAPHDALTGDRLTGERKRLTDKRFSLGC